MSRVILLTSDALQPFFSANNTKPRGGIWLRFGRFSIYPCTHRGLPACGTNWNVFKTNTFVIQEQASLLDEAQERPRDHTSEFGFDRLHHCHFIKMTQLDLLEFEFLQKKQQHQINHSNCRKNTTKCSIFVLFTK